MHGFFLYTVLSFTGSSAALGQPERRSGGTKERRNGSLALQGPSFLRFALSA